MATITETKLTIPSSEIHEAHAEEMNCSNRSQWLRAAILGANDGLVSITSLMIGIGAVKQDPKAMILSGFAGLVAGACSMAIGEFISVYSQLDIEVAQLKRDSKVEALADQESLPSPVQAAMASSMAFSIGASVPLLAAGFISSYEVRIGVVAAAASLALAVFGCVGALLGKAPVLRAGIRVLIGGWAAMAVTFGLMKLFRSGRL
ncbi:vacuolar iron transporter homolog 4-like [Phalaenopsis equestris]|uniref:vacuolar iron transporter homolog 4-like n=1 Tax=Phalaenopsis equestris TaxID=78828 RepID=UPI0009E5B656|nr:vacuolar iron transporter homolog 4-like [Phalaenopsis equestris]